MNNPITPLTPEQEAAQKSKAAHEGYLHRCAEEIDVTANVLTGGLQDETISSRWSRGAEAGNKLDKLGSACLDLLQHNHGAKAQAADLERAEVIEKTELSNGVLPTE